MKKQALIIIGLVLTCALAFSFSLLYASTSAVHTQEEEYTGESTSDIIRVKKAAVVTPSGHEETSHAVQAEGADHRGAKSHEADNTQAAESHGDKIERAAAHEPVSHEKESLGENTGRAEYQREKTHTASFTRTDKEKSTSHNYAGNRTTGFSTGT